MVLLYWIDGTLSIQFPTHIIRQRIHYNMNKETFQILKEPIVRLPATTVFAVLVMCKAFISAFILCTPVSMALSIPTMKEGIEVWFLNSISQSVGWSRVSAYYSGADAFSEGLRGRRDKWNSCYGCGLSNAILQYHMGPLTMAQAFIVGFGCTVIYNKFQEMLQKQDEEQDLVECSI